MRPAVLHAPGTAPSPQTPCVHCGLPVGRSPVGEPEGPFFCCTGCKMVYETLHASGLGDTYYRLKDVGSDTGLACPAPTSLDPLLLSELDSPSFTNDHTRSRDDGARTAELFLDGVHCAACVWLVERLPFELDGVIESVEDSADGIAPFDLTPLRLMSLPSRGPRLVALETDAPPGLLELQRRLARRLACNARTRHGGRYLPHFTLCRFKQGARPRRVDLRLAHPPFTVQRVVLVHSVLRPEGAEHRSLREVELR